MGDEGDADTIALLQQTMMGQMSELVEGLVSSPIRLGG